MTTGAATVLRNTKQATVQNTLRAETKIAK